MKPASGLPSFVGHSRQRPCAARCHSRTPACRVHGAALITSLLFLVVITLIGLSIFSTTTAEEKISRNARDREVAFAAAEAALRDAELRLTGRWSLPTAALFKTDFDPACANGLCDARAAALTSPTASRDFFDAGSTAVPIATVTGSPKLPGFPDTRQPRYMIEMLCGASCKEEQFRITVQARGRLPNTMVMLQELYLPPTPLVGAKPAPAAATGTTATTGTTGTQPSSTIAP